MSHPRKSPLIRLLSPFTNLGSRQFPLSRIRGASLKQRFKQTYEVFRGHTKQNSQHDSPKSAHFGITEYALVLPAALYTLNGILTKITKKIVEKPYVGLPTALILAMPRLILTIASTLLDFLVVVPASLIMTSLCTPLIVLTHLITSAPSSEKLIELTKQLTSELNDEQDILGVAKKNLRTFRVKSLSIRPVSTLDEQNAKDGTHDESDERRVITLALESKEVAKRESDDLFAHILNLKAETPEQKNALRSLLSTDAFCSARFFDTHPRNNQCSEILEALYPTTRSPQVHTIR